MQVKATNFFAKIKALRHGHFGKFKSLTFSFNRWQKIERKHEVDEGRGGRVQK